LDELVEDLHREWKEHEEQNAGSPKAIYTTQKQKVHTDVEGEIENEQQLITIQSEAQPLVVKALGPETNSAYKTAAASN
jgi:hypothetical protein